MKILFVCYGNVMRSQVAEAYYNHFTNTTDAYSAGTDPTTPSRYDRPIDEVIQIMHEEGIDVSNNVIKTITEELVAAADKIYVLTNKHNCPKYLINSTKVTYWRINDPFGATIENFRKTRDKIRQKVQNIISAKTQLYIG